MFNFERLEVWKRSIEFADAIYSVSKNFPKDEQFGLTSQLRRAAVSIAANIAEGNGRFSRKENIRFIEISYGSLMEAVSHLVIAERQGYLSAEQYGKLYSQAELLARMLSGLRASQQNITT